MSKKMTENQTDSIGSTLKKMSVGAKEAFPIEKMKTIRVAASEMGLIYNRKYKTATNRASRTIEVIRIS